MRLRDELDQAATRLHDQPARGVTLRFGDCRLQAGSDIPIEELADLGAFYAIFGHLAFGLIAEISTA
jgi:hypothetical protein